MLYTKMFKRQLHNVTFRAYLKKYIKLTIMELKERKDYSDDLIPMGVVMNLMEGKFD